MASTYSTDLKLELMATGENAGTWGTKTNTNLNLVQQAIAGFESINVTTTTVSLAMSDGAISQARNAVLNFAGTLGGGTNINELTLGTFTGEVGTAQIADNSVTTAKISDNQITTAKISANQITTSLISDNQITTSKINNDAVTAAKLERKFTISTSSPSGGNDGDIWFKYS